MHCAINRISSYATTMYTHMMAGATKLYFCMRLIIRVMQSRDVCVFLRLERLLLLLLLLN